MDKHASRIELFNSTLAILQQGWYIAQNGKKVTLPDTKDVMDSPSFKKSCQESVSGQMLTAP